MKALSSLTEGRELAALGHGLTDRRVAAGIGIRVRQQPASAAHLHDAFGVACDSRCAARGNRHLRLVGTPYAFKFLWSPLIDRLPPPLGWGGDVAGE